MDKFDEQRHKKLNPKQFTPEVTGELTSGWNPFEPMRRPLSENVEPHQQELYRMGTGMHEAIQHLRDGWSALGEQYGNEKGIVTVDSPAFSTQEHIGTVWDGLLDQADLADKYSRKPAEAADAVVLMKKAMLITADHMEKHPTYIPGFPHTPHVAKAISVLRNLA